MVSALYPASVNKSAALRLLPFASKVEQLRQMKNGAIQVTYMVKGRRCSTFLSRKAFERDFEQFRQQGSGTVTVRPWRLADYIQQLVPTSTAAPNLTAPLESFATFDWASIPATVDRSDQYGAAIVSWRGLQFVRRSPSNKFGDAIWFSRCVGKDEGGENKYERLITFKPLSKVEVEPVPARVFRLYGNS